MNMLHSYHKKQLSRYDIAIDELDELDRQFNRAMHIICNLLALAEGPKYINDHEHFKEAEEFVRQQTLNRCLVIKVSGDGTQHRCNNDLPTGMTLCPNCGGEWRPE
jgi:hypothetical protein